MKKTIFNKTLFCLIAVLLLVTLLFAACSRKGKDVPVPTGLAISGDVLTWEAVAGTLSYDVKVDDTVYSTQETRYSLPITDYEFHTITVRATTHDGTSEYATPLTYKRHASQTVLPALSTPVLSMTSNRLMWSSVMNNDGYWIYMGDTVITVEKNVTYYDLDFPSDGTYYLRMQALGDGVSYTNSKISNAYAVTVRDGKAPLQKLPKTEFTFDAETKSFVWTNRYSAAAVSYEIYRDGILIEPSIPADSTRVKMTYKPELKGGTVTYTMRLISNNGLYNPSDLNTPITFPIADAAPTELSISPNAEQGAYLIEWNAATYCDGYVLEIDGETHDAGTTLSMAVPTDLAPGRHVVRVRTKGLGVYYRDSLYGEGVVFYVDDKGAMTRPLDTPASPTLVLKEEGVLSVSVRPVEGAARYRFVFNGESGEKTLLSETDAFDLSEGRFGTRRATDAEAVIIGDIFADLPTGISVTVSAIPSSALYVESPRSRESFLSTGEDVTSVTAPDITFGADGLEWSDLEGDLSYELRLDGVLYDVAERVYVPEAGTHRARVRAKGMNALWSGEVFFRSPIDLSAPTSLALTGNVLSFTVSDHATGYRLVSNGEVIATVTSAEGKINLSNYFTTDGEYVLSLVATSGVATFCDSAPSRQILYVKNDAAYGTQVKPYQPTTAAALWTGMREDSSAYFRLTAGGVYDFTDLDLSATAAFTFKGTLMGNGATLKGIRLDSPLFEALTDATIRDVTIEAEVASFTFSQNGILAKAIRSTLLFGVTVSLSGQATLSADTAFGALCYEATDFTMRESSLRCDLTVLNTAKVTFGAVACRCEGVFSGVGLSGNVTLGGKEVRCGALSVSGDLALTDLTSSLTLTVNATESATIGGVSVEGGVQGTRLTTNNVISVNAAYPTYYGVAQESVTLSNAELAGNVSAQGSVVRMNGVAKGGTLSLTDVTVKTLLKGKATSSFTGSGIADELTMDVVTTRLSFEGEIDANAPTMAVAGVAQTALGSYTAKSAGTLKVTGKEAQVTAGVADAANATLECGATILLTKVTKAEVGGAAMTSSGKTTLSGALTVTAAECGEVRFGGAVATGDQSVEIGNYAIDGTIAADLVRFGGASYEGGAVTYASTGLSVRVNITSDDLKAAGAYLSAAGLSLSAPSVLSADISGVGSGEIEGFGGQIGSSDFSDLTVSGRLSLHGSGMLCGVADDAGATAHVASSVSLDAEGDVRVYGLFRSVASSEELALSDATISLKSDRALYTVVGSVRDGAISGATVTGMTFDALPLSAGGGEATIYGLVEEIKALDGIVVSGVSYHVGDFATATFCGLSETLDERIRSSSLSYTLRSDAADATIGGAFLTAKGDLTVDLGTQSAPLSIAAKGSVRIGGAVLDPQDLTLSGSTAYIDLTLDLSAESACEAGGLFADVDGSHTVTLSDCNVTVSLTRSGGGALTFGGAAATCHGTLIGAKVALDLRGGLSEDVFGGVIGELESGRLGNGSARGSLTSAGTVGGLIGVVTYGYLDGGASSVEIACSGKAGGVFGLSSGGRAQNVACIARLTDKGAGFFAEAENTTVLNSYFAGRAAEAALACRVTNTVSSFLYLDTALATLAGLPAVGEGTLSYAVRSFGYGYEGSDLGASFVADGKRYPYVRAIGPFAENTMLASRQLPSIVITESADLYQILPRFYDADTPTVTWVDASSRLSVDSGIATVTDNGSGTLYGVLSGGVRVYTVFYTAEGFVPLVGDGTAESPYLIRDMQYYHYVKDYAAAFSTAHFRFDLEEDTVEGAEFPELFTEASPFRGTMDFAGVTFLSPILPETGILGYLNGATVKGLRLGGALSGTLLAVTALHSTVTEVSLTECVLSGRTVLIGTAEDSHIAEVTVVGQSSAALDLALIGELTDAELEEVSTSITVSSSSAVSLSVIGRATNATISRVQSLWWVRMADSLESALVRDDVGSSYVACMTLTEARVDDAAETEVVGLALRADGTTFDDCAAILHVVGATAIELISDGTATFTDTVLYAEGATGVPAGVTLATVSNAGTLLAALDGYVDQDLPTPLGYDAFAEWREVSFSLTREEVTISVATPLTALTSLEGEKPFSTVVAYLFTGDCAVIEGGALRPTQNGTGLLTITNLYGESETLSVIVEDFDGFATGDGTKENPYLISDRAAFLKMLSQENEKSNVYYRLTTDLTDVEVTESATFRGVLTSDGHTVEIDLTADVLFDSVSGRIEGVDFLLHKESVTAESVSGVFAKRTASFTLTDSTVTVDCPVVTLADETTFGLLIGEAASSTELDGVTLSVGTVSVTAGENACVGLAFGRADGAFMKDVSVSGALTVVGTGELLVGAAGEWTANSETTVVYDEDTGVESLAYYVSDLVLDVTLVATADAVKAGGAAGRSEVSIDGVSGTVSVTVGGGEVSLGGVVGETDASVTRVSVTADVTSSDTIVGGYVGGVVGRASGRVADGTVVATVSVTAKGSLYVGGVAGGASEIADLRVTADVDAHSVADAGEVESLRDGDPAILLAAGGAGGWVWTRVARVAVTIERVRATADYAADDLMVIASGLVARLSYAEDVEIGGTGVVSSEGGRAVAAGVAALLSDGVERVVLSGVSLTGDEVYAAALTFTREDGWITDLYSAVAGLAATDPVVGSLSEGTTVDHVRYLSGRALGEGDPSALTDVSSLGSVGAFCAASLYAAFDTDLWNISGDAIPSLK